MKSSLAWAGILALVCLGCMVLFNVLAAHNDLAKEAYQSYASYSFDCLKVIFGMILGSLTEKFHTKQAEAAKVLAQKLLDDQSKNP